MVARRHGCARRRAQWQLQKHGRFSRVKQAERIDEVNEQWRAWNAQIPSDRKWLEALVWHNEPDE
jgi:hypothetical protein